MTLKDQHIVIVGNGIAGNSAVSAIRKQSDTARITLISDENLPLYSPCVFYKFLAGEKRRQQLFLKSFGDYSKERVGLVLGETVKTLDIKNKNIHSESKTIQFDKLILATGSQPIIPPIKGAHLNGVFTLKFMEDAEKIIKYSMKQVVVIGSGPIGLEVAFALRKKGSKVYVIEILNRILPRLFDEEPSRILKGIIEKHGIVVLTGERVEEIKGEEYVSSVVTNQREITCDSVIITAGVVPNVELAKEAGLEIGKLGGIKTNEYMQTSVEDVYSCGDCVESEDIVTVRNTLSLLWHNAKRQGEVVGYNCVKGKKRYTGSIDAVSIDTFGTHAISVGKTAFGQQDKENYEVVEKIDGSSYCRMLFLQDRLVGAQFITKPENAGLLLSLMIRQDNLRLLSNTIANKKLISLYPWRYRIRQYL